MKPLSLFALVGTGLCALVVLLIVLGHAGQFTLLFPSGSIGLAERDLMARAVMLMLIVVVPVIILAIFIAWHYRASNTNAKYTPQGEHSVMEELIWWSIPIEIVLVLAALTWNGTYQLDPPRPLPGNTSPLVVQVVALPWKWLFIYPQEGIASLNEFALPVNRPVRFEITADAPMNSFWIPALGGQMYAMTGMTTVLNLDAKQAGDYQGLSANYSGEGFAQMKFVAKAMSDEEFAAWIRTAQSSANALTADSYAMLRKPGDAGPVQYFSRVTMPFKDIANSYMLGGMTMDGSHMDAMPGMQMH